jgi:hypothetical protein
VAKAAVCLPAQFCSAVLEVIRGCLAQSLFLQLPLMNPFVLELARAKSVICNQKKMIDT